MKYVIISRKQKTGFTPVPIFKVKYWFNCLRTMLFPS